MTTRRGEGLLRDAVNDPEEPLYVLADPAGHPFCVFVGWSASPAPVSRFPNEGAGAGSRFPNEGAGAGQTNAETPVTARPTISVFIP